MRLTKLAWSICAVAILAALPIVSAPAQEPDIPSFWDSRERIAKPDLASLPRLRFLTTTDFPPFNYIDAQGRLTGFHVDLSRAICTRLAVMAKCQIQALPWDELADALARGDGEAILAGVAVTAQSRQRYAFTRPYLRLPARFLVRRDRSFEEPLDERMAGERVGVLTGSAHERILRELFSAAAPVPFETEAAMLAELKGGKIAAVFGDAMRLGYWQTGSDADGCCTFAGGPYLMPSYLGSGLAIATRPEDAALAAALDYALQAFSNDGGFAELYLRYFPTSIY